MQATLYLVRHATPDWSRTDLRYDIPPGPPLTAQGEQEAVALGDFLRRAQVTRLYASPLDRTLRTAALAAQALDHLLPITDESLAEWRQGESDQQVLARIRPRVDAALDESTQTGAVALVTHGGPIRLILADWGLDRAEIDYYRRLFDRDNPVPPAGVWRLARDRDGRLLKPELVHTPQPFQPYTPATVHL